MASIKGKGSHRYVTDSLWSKVAVHLPPDRPSPRTARPHLPNRAAMEGILYALLEDVGWLKLPRTLTGVTGSSVWRRLRQWQDTGIWDKVAPVVVQQLAGITDEQRKRVLTGRIRENAKHHRRSNRQPSSRS